MKVRTKSNAIRDLLGAVTGKTVGDAIYKDRLVYGRKGTDVEFVCGKVTNTSICSMAGCGGTKLHVLWPDSSRTYPCIAGCLQRENGDLEII